LLIWVYIFHFVGLSIYFLFIQFIIFVWHLHFVFVLAKAYSPLGRPTYISGNNAVIFNPIVQMVAEKLGKTPAQVVLRWGLQMGHTVLPKTKNEARMKENLDLFDWSIPEELFAKFSGIEQAISLLYFSALVHQQQQQSI
jgi:diketogulonate reductase-like aldo/keto reductase